MFEKESRYITERENDVKLEREVGRTIPEGL